MYANVIMCDYQIYIWKKKSLQDISMVSEELCTCCCSLWFFSSIYRERETFRVVDVFVAVAAELGRELTYLPIGHTTKIWTTLVFVFFFVMFFFLVYIYAVCKCENANMFFFMGGERKRKRENWVYLRCDREIERVRASERESNTQRDRKNGGKSSERKNKFNIWWLANSMI